jgi:uncharacterized damage-inducible protein DinB
MKMSAANPIKQIALADLENELATTRRVLERVPDEHFDWKPHAKSSSLGGLATHIANLVGFQLSMIQEDGLDILNRQLPPGSAENREKLLERFDSNAAALRAALEPLDDAALQETWTFRRGEHVVFALPRAVTIRTLGLSHIAHHRGQLTVYLRLLDIPVPSVYGPTADEKM